MDNGFFDSSGGGDPVFFQNFWYLGHPQFWLTVIIWALILCGIYKGAARLWRARKTLWLAIFIAAVITALASYIYLSVNAFDSYAQGLGLELRGLRIAKIIVICLSILSGVWIIADRFKNKG